MNNHEVLARFQYGCLNMAYRIYSFPYCHKVLLYSAQWLLLNPGVAVFPWVGHFGVGSATEIGSYYSYEKVGAGWCVCVYKHVCAYIYVCVKENKRKKTLRVAVEVSQLASWLWTIHYLKKRNNNDKLLKFYIPASSNR